VNIETAFKSEKTALIRKIYGFTAEDSFEKLVTDWPANEILASTFYADAMLQRLQVGELLSTAGGDVVILYDTEWLFVFDGDTDRTVADVMCYDVKVTSVSEEEAYLCMFLDFSDNCTSTLSKTELALVFRKDRQFEANSDSTLLN
jgi:hypothetical protein